MKSFDQRRAEIFRLGEEKIKKQKQLRNRLLALCIPVCLCLGAWGISALPGADNSAGDNMAPEANVGGMGGLVMGSTSPSYVAVEIQTGDTLYHIVTGKDDATMFYDSFSDIYSGASPDAGTGAPESSTLETYGDDLHNGFETNMGYNKIINIEV